jgi:GNAT superfamily N-acetyltransferase
MISVRPATVADIPALVSLMEEFYAESSFPLDRASAGKSFEALFREPARGAVWLLLDGGEAAGHVVLTTRFAMEHGGLDAFIDDLFVRPAHRRRGLARAGLEALFAECRRRGVLAVNVEVGDTNAPARALYGGFGLAPRTDRRVLLTTTLGREVRP